MTTREYLDMFGSCSNGITTLDHVTKLCRSGEIPAHKDEKGIWVIDIPVPKFVLSALKEWRYHASRADGLWTQYYRAEKQASNAWKIVQAYLDDAEEDSE